MSEPCSRQRWAIVVDGHVESTPDALELLRMRRSGMTLKAIGQNFGVGQERVRQQLMKTERLERHRAEMALFEAYLLIRRIKGE